MEKVKEEASKQGSVRIYPILPLEIPTYSALGGARERSAEFTPGARSDDDGLVRYHISVAKQYGCTAAPHRGSEELDREAESGGGGKWRTGMLMFPLF